ncbi:MAG: (Fe-S)-binding protein [Chloroflexota bacterium]|nr:(Fe-S)-binding protein [Chloroflexota bacterium]
MALKQLDLLTEDRIDRQFMKQVEPDWKKVLTCFQCGTCSVSCPAAESMDYTPRQLWQLLRLGLRDQVLSSRTFWLCTQCYACTARCPRGIMTSETMRNLREWAVAQNLQVPPTILQLRDTVKATYNILNEDNRSRLIWSQNLAAAPTQLQNSARHNAEVLLFTGCVSSFYPVAYSIPQSLVQVLEQAKITYTTLGGEEWCCGYPLYGAGMKSEVANLARHNIEQVKAREPQNLVATCASCYHTWRHLYPAYTNGTCSFGFQVLHASEFLARLIDEKRIKLAKIPWVVTYHDPCDLGRKSGVYDAPRFIIKSIPGMTLREMPSNREDAMCCGGGGDVAMMQADVTDNIAVRRLAEAVGTGAEAIISSCQQCKRTLLGAARKTKTRIKILDVTELVWQAMEK